MLYLGHAVGGKQYRRLPTSPGVIDRDQFPRVTSGSERSDPVPFSCSGNRPPERLRVSAVGKCYVHSPTGVTSRQCGAVREKKCHRVLKKGDARTRCDGHVDF